MIGRTLDGKYEILELIGEGAMGAVYRGKNPSGEAVAVKLIVDEEVADDHVLVARFEREAHAAAQVHSPHIVEILDAGHDAGTGHPYMVMELLHGETLQQLLDRLGALPPELALRIGVQTCIGLADAHRGGVVHRDIKPANLLLARGDGTQVVVKLLDFGVAKFKMDQASASDNASLTRTGSMLGSPMYMSPEQARGLKSIDHRADIWSLGVVLHEMLTGHQPHEGAEGLGELIISICSEPPQPVTELAPWCPPELEAAVARALALTPASRYPTADEMCAALRRCLPDAADHGIDASMLVALSDEQRAARPTAAPPPAAPAEDLHATVMLPEGGAPVSVSDVARTVAFERAPSSAEFQQEARERSAPRDPAPAEPAPAPRVPPPPAEPKTRGAWWLLGLVLLVAGAWLVYRLIAADAEPLPPGPAPSVAPPPAPAAPLPVEDEPEDDAADAPSAAPSSSAAPSGARVRVEPPTAGVVVDGKLVKVDPDGYFTIDAPPDSRVLVTVTVANKSRTVLVRMTDRGPEPAAIRFQD
jgi:serine/threonine-protein kinase